MGISGGNFGVAETGSVCLVTNEGNGRLTTTVPRIHVALMGIERIVPTMADLGDGAAGARAQRAPGQPLSVYTNILTGPRRGGGGRRGDEPDGPDEVHVVLVDNGRSELLGTELAEILYCIRCGACLNACPVYQAIGGHAYGSVYPGPVGRGAHAGACGLGVFGELPHASSLCGACREVCPVRIDIPRMLLALCARAVEEVGQPALDLDGAVVVRAARDAAAAVRVRRGASRRVSRAGRAGRLGAPAARAARPLDGAPATFPPMPARSFQDAWRLRKERTMTDQRTLLDRDLRAQPAAVATAPRFTARPRPPAALGAADAGRGGAARAVRAEWQSLAGHVHEAASDGEAVERRMAAICRARRPAPCSGGATRRSVSRRPRASGWPSGASTVDHGDRCERADARRARLQALTPPSSA